MTVRQELRRRRSAFVMVRQSSYPRGAVTEVRYTRLDEHYHPAVELARLIIENSDLMIWGPGRRRIFSRRHERAEIERFL